MRKPQMRNFCPKLLIVALIFHTYDYVRRVLFQTISVFQPDQ